jgi:hypothetical protein
MYGQNMELLPLVSFLVMAVIIAIGVVAIDYFYPKNSQNERVSRFSKCSSSTTSGTDKHRS